MTKKDYEKIASVIFRCGDIISKQKLIADLADAFAQDNPRFDRDRFFNACYSRPLLRRK